LLSHHTLTRLALSIRRSVGKQTCIHVYCILNGKRLGGYRICMLIIGSGDMMRAGDISVLVSPIMTPKSVSKCSLDRLTTTNIHPRSRSALRRKISQDRGESMHVVSIQAAALSGRLKRGTGPFPWYIRSCPSASAPRVIPSLPAERSPRDELRHSRNAMYCTVPLLACLTWRGIRFVAVLPSRSY
jgi:hypothetical protein